MKLSTFSLSTLIFLFLAFPSTYVSAHIPSYDPYGTQAMHKSSLEHCKFKSDVWCENYWNILIRAASTKDVATCERDYIANIRSQRQSYSEESIRDEAEGSCAEAVREYSIVGAPSWLISFDKNIPFISAILGLIYSLIILKYGGMRGWRLWLVTPVFQFFAFILVSIVGIFLTVRHKYSVTEFSYGPAIPPFHDVFFFQTNYIQSIFTSGFVTALLYFFLILSFFNLFSLIRGKSMYKTAFVFTLVANPFFFPVGQIVGLMHIIYTKMASQINTTQAQ